MPRWLIIKCRLLVHSQFHAYALEKLREIVHDPQTAARARVAASSSDQGSGSSRERLSKPARHNETIQLQEL